MLFDLVCMLFIYNSVMFLKPGAAELGDQGGGGNWPFFLINFLHLVDIVVIYNIV